MRILIIISYLIPFIVFGQGNPVISQSVIGSSGSYVISSNLNIAFTVGEPMISTVSSSSYILTQGFHQSIAGCTDSLSYNYNIYATYEDSSCGYCIYGCTSPIAFNYDSLATCDDGSCIPIIYGCTDPNSINFYPGANTDDGSCIYFNCTNPSPTGLSNNWVTDTKAGISWNNMNDSTCMVWKYYVRYREVGTPTWTTKSAGVGNGLCNFGLNTTTKTLQNLTSSTTYEYKM